MSDEKKTKRAAKKPRPDAADRAVVGNGRPLVGYAFGDPSGREGMTLGDVDEMLSPFDVVDRRRLG